MTCKSKKIQTHKAYRYIKIHVLKLRIWLELEQIRESLLPCRKWQLSILLAIISQRTYIQEKRKYLKDRLKTASFKLRSKSWTLIRSLGCSKESCKNIIRRGARDTVLVRVSIALKKHYSHSNSNKRKTFNWGGWHFLKCSPLSSCWNVAACRSTWYWSCSMSCEVADSSMSCEGNRK